MRGRVKLMIVMAIVAVSALASVPAIASTGGNPTPGPSATVSPVPATIPAQNYVPRGLPVVNPFAGCRFSQTDSFTYSRTLGQFITRVVPAIVCIRLVNGVRQVRVFDLVLQR
jgi:hypothetical protein